VDAKQSDSKVTLGYGKATIVAIAYDPRFAIGLRQLFREGGAQTPPPHWGEMVRKRRGSGEYHWNLAVNFLKYAGRPELGRSAGGLP